MIDRTGSQTYANAYVAGQPTGQRQYCNSWTKRLFDLAFVSLAMPIILPVVLILIFLVRLDGGSGMFGHWRIGRNGQPFRCWKLRTMVPDAELRLKELLADCSDRKLEWQQNYKLRNDPRVTRLGKVLRKTGLDELPQIWNVITGEMSIVGPRPVIEEELENYGINKRAYLSARPGLTGNWQVHGRGHVSYSQRVGMDQSYLAEASFSYDLRLILRTIPTVLKGAGT